MVVPCGWFAQVHLQHGGFSYASRAALFSSSDAPRPRPIQAGQPRQVDRGTGTQRVGRRRSITYAAHGSTVDGINGESSAGGSTLPTTTTTAWGTT